MKRPTALIGLALWICGAIGCAPVISSELRNQADPFVTFAMVQKAPQQYKSKIVIWSGSIVETTNTQQGTLIEILQHAADSSGKPTDTDHSEGRFMILDPRFLDPAIYAAGRLVTVAGHIQGSRSKIVGQLEYRYPFLEVRELVLWPKEERYRQPYYDPYYYDRPWWWRLQIGTGWMF